MKDPGAKKARSNFLNPDDVLQSRYRILRSLNSEEFPKGITSEDASHSAYSRTYLAADLMCFNELRVLKQFAPKLTGIHVERVQELFEREVGVFYRLQHSQIPRFWQLFHGDRDEKYLFLVRDYVIGETYNTLLVQNPARNGRFNTPIGNKLEEKIYQNPFDNMDSIIPNHLMPVLENRASHDGDRAQLSTAEISSIKEMFSLQEKVKPAFPLSKSKLDIHPASETAKPNRELHLFNEAEIRQLLIQVLPILEYIHSMGIIHRHISPDNLILRSQDKLTVLINFACIQEFETKIQSELIGADISSIATMISKTGYSPPEQIERGVVYAHSDLYALAATAVVLLTGKKPEQLIDPSNHHWQWQSEVTVSSKLEWILSTMLSPHPSDRFVSATEVSKTIQDILIVTTPQPIEVYSKRGLHRPWLTDKTVLVGDLFSKLPKKVTWTNNLLAKFLLFMPFVAASILGVYLYLKMANSKLPDPSSNARSELITNH